jgi:NAD(P)-dependent dehydrogenase (short-subunit alcohol dehydrogenase family)
VAEVSLQDRVAIVTGSGAGLGRAYALDLARRGAALVVNDIAAERAAEVVAEIEGEGGRAVASDHSVADRPGARQIVQTAIGEFGRVDAVVNNAGSMRNAYFEDQTPEDLDAMLAVHVGGCFHVTQAAWPHLREQGYGRVLMVSSSGGMWSMHAISNYAAAKGGVYGLGRALAFEGREHGILVNNLLPGAATTITADSPVPDYAEHFPHEALGAALGPRRTAESVAPLVSFLASEACTVTGETYSAVAGRYARVLVGVTEGWFAEDPNQVTAEDIAEHFEEISDPSEYHLPASLFDEYLALAERLGVEVRA